MKPPDQRRGHPKKGHPQRPQLAAVDSAGAGAASIAPDPPKGIKAAAKRRWAAYWASPVARAVDLGADLYVVERWIRLVDELETVYPVFKRERVVDGSMGQPTLNPLAKYIQDLQGQMAKLEAQLGIGPMSRLRLGLTLAEGRMTADKLNEQLDAVDQDEADSEPGQDERAAIEAEWSVASS